MVRVVVVVSTLERRCREEWVARGTRCRTLRFCRLMRRRVLSWSTVSQNHVAMVILISADPCVRCRFWSQRLPGHDTGCLVKALAECPSATETSREERGAETSHWCEDRDLPEWPVTLSLCDPSSCARPAQAEARCCTDTMVNASYCQFRRTQTLYSAHEHI